jgi:alcohol dehydrogenase (NADP+)
MPDQFEGFMVHDPKNWSTFHKQKFDTKNFEDSDVDIKIECCGVCGSDVHTITGGWGEVPMPLCVGHEVIGTAVRVGPNCKTGVKVGDRVGVGAQVAACLKCNVCKDNNENYCPHQIDTYGAPYESEASGKVVSQGGFASHIRCHEYFVFPIPDEIPSVEAAPMMCAGLTSFSPLYRAKVGPGKHVAIVGIGGLGHFAIMWAKALGAKVTALSHSKDKEADAKSLGADEFVYTGKEGWEKDLAFTFDFILNCADMTQEFNLPAYFSTLKINCEFHNVGLPDAPLPALKAQDYVSTGCKMGVSHIGSRVEMLEMLRIAVEHKVKPRIETIEVSEQGCKKAVEKVKVNDVRYRVTLTGFEKVFGK